MKKKVLLIFTLCLVFTLFTTPIFAHTEMDYSQEQIVPHGPIWEHPYDPGTGGGHPLVTPNHVVFLLHGMGGSANAWNVFRSNVETYRSNTGRFLNIVVSSGTQRAQIYNALRTIIIRPQGILYVKVNFSNTHGRVSEQAEELHTIVSNFKDIFSNNTRYSFKGHSKGGLVASYFVSRVQNENARIPIHRIITFGTPFQLHWWHYFNQWFGDDETIGNIEQMNHIRDRWNGLSANLRPRSYAFATETNFLVPAFNSDGVVPSSIANGSAFNGFIGTTWIRPYNNSYRHANMINNRTVLDWSLSRMGYWYV